MQRNDDIHPDIRFFREKQNKKYQDTRTQEEVKKQHNESISQISFLPDET